MVNAVIFISLHKGKIEIKLDDGTKRYFTKEDHEGLGEFLAQHPGWDFLTSSSVNHPYEYGFSESFDIGDVMGKAVAHAYDKLAIPVEPGPPEKAEAAIQEAVKRYRFGFPLPLRFVRGGKGGLDSLGIFPDQEQLNIFIGGLKYACNLAKIAI
jgi:hypothetical protein